MKVIGKSKGLGDSIAKVTHALGIDKVADAIAKLANAPGCGCEERRQYLNELFPYGKTRKFEVTRNFNIDDKDYFKGDVITTSKEDPFHEHTIGLVQNQFIKEL